MRSWLLIGFGILISTLIAISIIYSQKLPTGSNMSTPMAQVSGAPQTEQPPAASSAGPATLPSSNPSPDLTVDANGMSKATMVLNTNQGVIKFKFYSNDAPKTVKRIIELAHQGFYNGLTFHRVVPGFVIQGGDPNGNGTGGSGQKLDPELNNRNNVEGTVAMARSSDPASADSQFYISLGTHPNLDHNYTIFGQVTEGMDVAKKISPGDKMVTVLVE